MIARDLAPLLRRAAATMPVVTLTGPRQSGKTTLCRALFPTHVYRTLEAPDARAFALGDPCGFLAELPDGAEPDGAEGVVIDEIQRAPALLHYLRGTVDDDPAPGRWILVGSRNPLLPESISRSLAGRAELHELLPLTWGEIRRFAHPPVSLDEAIFTGGYPRILDHALDPTAWLRAYIDRYLERDVRTILNVGDLATFQRFLESCASRTGQLLNYSSLANDCGISRPTAKKWVDVLEASCIAFRLPAFRGNLRKRLVKTPKLYFCDTGLACWLLGIHELRQLGSHPLRGPIFETWVVSEVLKNRSNLGLGQLGLTFYRDRNGVEADLVIDHASGRTPGRTPRRTLVEARSSGSLSSDMLRTIRRVRNHFPEPLAGDPVVVYGGDERQAWRDGEVLPWRMVRDAALRDGAGVVQVLSGGRPVAGANVLVVSPIHPNVRWKSARTDARGEAILDLAARPPSANRSPSPSPSLPLTLPLTLFVAAPGFEAWLEREWIPAERTVAIELARLPGGGGVIFPQGWGSIPGLAGRVTVTAGDYLSPFGQTFDTAHIRAENIAINGEMTGEMAGEMTGEPERPVYIRPGLESPLLHVEDDAGDDAGSECWIRILKIVGRSALVEYRREPLASPREAPVHPRCQGQRVGRSR